MDDTISRQAAIDAIDLITWYHQNRDGEMAKGANSEDQAWYKAEDIYKVLNDLPSAQQYLYGYDVEHLKLIARVLQKENLPPERVAEAINDIGRIITIAVNEYEEFLREAVRQCMT